MSSSTEEDSWLRHWPLALTAVAIAALVQWVRLDWLATRRFDPDEFQHLHIAWRISKGDLPYRDFFDHHLPLFHILLAPLHRFYRVAGRFRDAHAFLLLAREVSWLFAGVSVALTFFIGRAWRGPAVGFLAMALLAPARVFVYKGGEVRPDGMALALLLGAVLFLVLEAHAPPLPRRVRGRYLMVYASGFLFGAALLTSPKVLFTVPCFLLALVVRNDASAVRTFGSFALGTSLPILAPLVWLARGEALAPMVLYVLRWNVAWQVRFSPLEGFTRLAQQSPFLCAMGIVGFGFGLARVILRRGSDRSDLVIVSLPVALCVGLFLNPVPYLQSFLPLIPVLALLGASAAADLVSLLRLRAQAAAVILATGLAVASLGPWHELQSINRFDNKEQLADLRWVYRLTRPRDTVLDTWTGLGVYRPHAWFFFCLPEDVRAMVPFAARRELLKDLQSGAVRPKLIADEAALVGLSSELQRFVSTRYTRSRSKLLWVRNPEPGASEPR